MSFSEDVVLAKLSSLTEAQDSIVGISQWVMFHKRYADKTAEIWDKAVRKSPPNKRLALVYLANEVCQQSRIKKWDQFITAFSDHVPGALGFAYRNAPTPDTKARIKRVADVWRHRQIFPVDVLDNVDAALSDTKKAGVRGAFGGLGGSSSSSSSIGGSSNKLGQSSLELPPVLSKLASIHKDLTNTAKLADSALEKANKDYESTVESDNLPAPKEYARKLKLLGPLLSSAHLNLSKRISTRKEFIEQLKSLTSASETLLKEDESKLSKLDAKIENVSELQTELDGMISTDEKEKNQQHQKTRTNKEKTRSTTPPLDPRINRSSSRQQSNPFSFDDDDDNDNDDNNNDDNNNDDNNNDDNNEREETAEEIGARTTTPPASYEYNPNKNTSNNGSSKDAFGPFSIVDEESNNTNTTNTTITKRQIDSSVPQYAESSDEDDEDEPNNQPNKRAKHDENTPKNANNTTSTSGSSATATPFAGLDPKVAQFLSSIAKGGGLSGSE